jgi:hypothetical protein
VGKYGRTGDFFKTRYALVAPIRWLRMMARPIGMLDAQRSLMFFKPENRALRALLWFVIIFVPGGLFLLALLAADVAQRRFRERAAAPGADLVDTSLTGLGSTRG